MSRDVTTDHWLETYKSLITLSVEAFKFSALINGGAAVALLAYLGNVSGRVTPSPDMRYSMLAFLLGLTLCGFSMLAAYLTQLKLLNEIGRSGNAVFHHTWLLWSGIFLFASSLAAFGIGAWLAVVHFK